MPKTNDLWLNQQDPKAIQEALSTLLSAAADYIDVLERRLSADFNNSWNWLDNPTNAEIAGKKGAWLVNKSIAELKGR